MTYQWICHPKQNFNDGCFLVGNKGASLFNIANLGLRVPYWFTITTEVCKFYSKNRYFPPNLLDEIKESLSQLEKETNKKLGKREGNSFPLLLSVRSGAPISMPGMMDTILNLGLNEFILEDFKEANLFMLDTYRRFIIMYASIIGGIDRKKFLTQKYVFTEKSLKDVIKNYKSILEELNFFIPNDPLEQLSAAVLAVIKSWWNPRAITYRKLHNISHDLGTAVTIQSMVFGNLDKNSGTGVVFTRNPVNGEKTLYGEYLPNAQGEDIVSGEKTPLPLSILNDRLPDVFSELKKNCLILENHYKNVQDIEFTIERGILYILQSRNAKRTGYAAIKTAVDFFEEGQITFEEAINQIRAKSLKQVLYTSIKYNKDCEIIGKGLPASPGCASGVIAFSLEVAQNLSINNKKVILVRHETSADDIIGMVVSEGILTAFGGMTSHAAVIARSLGKPCVCGANIEIDLDKKQVKIGEFFLKEEDNITIDGSTGNIILGKIDLVTPNLPKEFNTLMSLIKGKSQMEVRANAETLNDIINAINFSTDGVGLCRTEHMFFSLDRIKVMRQLILNINEEEKQEILNKLQEFQKGDFLEFFKILEGKPINIRLLDPPLHEFFSTSDDDLYVLSNQLQIPLEDLKNRVNFLKEVNPMLGNRGCRLGITYPYIYEMQIRAIFLAAIECIKSYKIIPSLEIMVPFVSTESELINIKNLVIKIANDVQRELNCHFDYKFGTMIELPRAALQADILAKHVDFFSFGTNDLTQAVYGMSRDDYNKFFPKYISQKIISSDPFTELDEEGVGQLIDIAVNKARSVKSNIKLGICGEHVASPKSILFFQKLKFNYISCSPYFIPQSRLIVIQNLINKIIYEF